MGISLKLEKPETQALVSILDSHIASCDCEDVKRIKNMLAFHIGEKKWVEDKDNVEPITLPWKDGLWLREIVSNAALQGSAAMFILFAKTEKTEKKDRKDLMERFIMTYPFIAAGVMAANKIREATNDIILNLVYKAEHDGCDK